MTGLRSLFDVLLLDLDGTVYMGEDPIVGAVDALAKGNEKQYFVTNNASRSPGHVSDHLRRLGFDTNDSFVVTSAQSAAQMLADRVEAGSAVLVVGTEALAAEISEVGLRPVRSATENPAAVVQGHSTTTDWGMLAEAVYAIRDGATWVATNVDATLPTERGFGPGNGSMVAAVRHATDVEPLVAGKPASPIMRDAIRRSGAQSPLVVGDRLDTDIAGAVDSELPSLLVLTGVSRPADVLRASDRERPTYIGVDLEALNRPAVDATVGPRAGWSATVADATLVVSYDGDDTPRALDGLLAAASVAWASDGFDKIRVDGNGRLDGLRELLEK